MEEVLKTHTELEVKYRVSQSDLFPFKKIIEDEFNVERFEYVTGPDYYFVKPGTQDFIRYRCAKYQTHEGELTMKRKRHSSNNINRTEVNIKLKDPSLQDITKMADLLGFSLNFTVLKDCYIFELSDCFMSFYSVSEVGSKKAPLFFIEIEIKEDIVDLLSAKESLELLKFYENKLSKLNISARKRVKKSLFEIFRK